MRVKSRKPPAENLMTSERVDLFEIVGGADDIVGDEMRHVAGDRQHEIVMGRAHHLDVRSERLPKRAHALDGASGRRPRAA